MVYHFLIILRDSDPLVWRRIEVPAPCSFYQLHMAIQGAFGWQNNHLFQFSPEGILDRVCYGFPDEFAGLGEGPVTIDAENALISEVFTKAGQRYSYIYDLGDTWEHDVILEKKAIKKNIDIPFCTDGGGCCPPEDVGGVDGYRRMLTILDSVFHGEKIEYREWLGLADNEEWDASLFDVQMANVRFSLLR